MRRAYQGLNPIFRTHGNHKWGITYGSSTYFHRYLKTTNHNALLEMPRLDSATEFFTEPIKQSTTKQVYSQFFSKRTLSQWLSRYANNKGRHSEQTVSVEEFDSLKHRSTEQPDTLVRATDCVSGLGAKLLDLSIRDELPLPNQTLHTSNKWDFLDKIIVSPADFREPVEAEQMEIVADGIPDGLDPVSSREKFLHQCLGKREAEYKEKKQFTLFCGSWNVFGQKPPDSLDAWLLVDQEPPDIYAIGFQEVDWSKHALMNMASWREGLWLDKVSKCINYKGEYVKVMSVRLVGVLLVVYILKKHIDHVTFADVDSVPTGIMGVVGNKGGVSLRLTFHKTSLCFITAHLAAHQDNVAKRNSDYKEIMKKIRFKLFKPNVKIQGHDLVFWFGDLNYRIDLPVKDTIRFIENKQYQPLYDADQLCQLLKNNSEAFKGFKEGILDFDPTFCFKLGTDTYNTSNDHELPAYCDRILWRGSGVQQLRFNSHPELKSSDHKPISSLFKLDVTVTDENKYKDVYEEIMKMLDEAEKKYTT